MIAVAPQTPAHLPKAQAPEALSAALAAPFPHWWLLIGGCLCSILGGYVAAWLAKHDELLNGALSAWLCIAFGIAAFGASVRGGTPVWEVILGELASARSVCSAAISGPHRKGSAWFISPGPDRCDPFHRRLNCCFGTLTRGN
jgi:hypothetical protein